MTPLDDDLLTALRAARPAASCQPSATSPKATAMLIGIMRTPRAPAPGRAHRWLPQTWRHARRLRPARPLLLTGAASAALAAGLAVALIVAPGGIRRPGSGPGAAFARATTAAAVLRKAALAALAEPAITPRPDQFVYSKVYTDEAGWPTPETDQTWLSVSGTRVGLQAQSGGALSGTHPEQACINGRVHPVSWLRAKLKWKYPRGFDLHCTPADFAAYLPGLPTKPAALRTWLDKTNHIRPGPAGAIGLLWVTRQMLSTVYFTAPQRAALYAVLAQAPGLKVVPKAATVRGRTGVGVRWTLHPSPGGKPSTYTLVFTRKTYQLLGMNWTGRLSLDGAAGGDALIKLAIVSKAGQLP
jgi:hypothetical protein